MKKLLLLCLVLVGYVGTVSARTIFFKPVGNWIQYESNYALYVWKEGNINRWYAFSSADDIGGFEGVYKVEIDDSYTGMKLCRMNPSTSVEDYAFNENCYDQSNDITIPSYSEVYYETYSDIWKNFDPKSSLLPWKYYFMSNTGEENAWRAVEEMTESSGTYTYSISGSEYAGKYFSWAKGEAFRTNGTIVDSSWDTYVYRPAETTNQEVAFVTYNANVAPRSGNGVWVMPSTDDGVTVNISFTPGGSSTVTFTCTKTVEINSVGYNTYSNGEMCTISGATPYTISRENTNSTVHMKPWNAETVWPVNEGMILKGTPGATVTIHSVESGAGATDVGTNYLVGSGNSNKGDIDVSANGTKKTIYVLANKTHGIGFYLATAGTLPAHKAYLDLSGGGEAREFLGFSFDDEEINGIAEAQMVKGDGIIYNLQGVRLSQLQKGLNIVNGKKMLVK